MVLSFYYLGISGKKQFLFRNNPTETDRLSVLQFHFVLWVIYAIII